MIVRVRKIMKLKPKEYHLFSVSNNSFIYLMTPIDSTNDQSIMRKFFKTLCTH